jgi:simple sugar transport system permease protein
MLMPVWAVLAALLAGSLLILLAGSNPLDAYAALFGGAFLDYYGLGATLVKVSPLLLAGLAVAVPMRAGLFNIGGEGQIYIGALFSTAAALYLPATTPVLDISICALAGMVGGGLWAFIAAYLKAYRGINEVITTILLNYIGIYVVSYFVNGPMKEPGAVYPSSPEISMDLWLPIVMPRTDAHLGGAIGLAAALMLYVIYRYTTFGFAAETVGRNQDAARYAGINVPRQIMISLVLGGSLAGLAGGFEVLGLKYRLFSMFSDGYGYDGIVVALLVSANILLVPLAALFMAGLAAGASIMSRAVGVDATVVGAIQGLVVIFVAASVAARFNRAFWTRFLTGKTANRSRPDEAGAR